MNHDLVLALEIHSIDFAVLPIVVLVVLAVVHQIDFVVLVGFPIGFVDLGLPTDFADHSIGFVGFVIRPIDFAVLPIVVLVVLPIADPVAAHPTVVLVPVVPIVVTHYLDFVVILLAPYFYLMQLDFGRLGADLQAYFHQYLQEVGTLNFP